MDQNIDNKQVNCSKESLKQRLEQSGKRLKYEQENLSVEKNEVADERLLLKNRLIDTKKNRVLVIEKINSESEQKDNVNNTINNSHRKKTWLLIILLSIVFFIVAALCAYLIVIINIDKEKQEKGRLFYEENVKINQIGSSEKSFVDLGLPSGTLWATCNVGATKPEEIGNYFAWGEVVPKNYYDPLTYKWWYKNDLTKYYNLFMVSKNTLELSDDVANVNWGGNWRMPTETELRELISYTDEGKFYKNGVSGIELTSVINGNTIFFPGSGYKVEDKIYNSDVVYCWSSSLSENDYHAFCIEFGSYLWTEKKYRAYGLPVRPVKNKYIAE
ncbi:MAG: DUF1566 domain-containing protein [Paludibacteraceae bacterium]|nr:DUF1566 domain-containing protein [Paludibacteraceae bacterium]